MITLNPTLQTAQNGQSHVPIIELVSSSYLADIPFDGQSFNDLATTEGKSNVIAAATGRIVGTIIRGGDLYMLATDADRTQWTETLIVSAGIVLTACPVELLTGNIGIVYVDGSYTIKSVVVSQDGATIGTPATLVTYASTHWVGDVHVSKQSDNTYRLVFSYRDNAASYKILLTTSSNFTTWAATSEIAVSGMGDTLRYGNPSLLESLQSDELFLFFDYVDSVSDDGSELINVYYQISNDMGATWGAPVALTAYDQYGTIGYHPSAANRTDGKIELAWTEKNNVLHVDADTTGFQTCDGTYCASGEMFGTDFHYDAASNKLFIKSIYPYVGNKTLCSVIVLDVATWTIDKCYTPATVPAYNQIFCDDHVWSHRWYDTGHYVCAGVMGGTTAMIIDTISDVIKTYQFIADLPDYGLTKNVDTNFTGTGNTLLKAGYLDSDSGRFYMLFMNTYYYTHKFYLGYVDITEVADGITGKYTWHQVIESNLLPEEELVGINQLSIIPSLGYAMLAFHNAASDWYGRLLLISLTSGGIVKDYYYPENTGFHRNGIFYPCYYDGKIYGSFTYMSANNMADRRGLMAIDLASDTVQYHVPTYKTADDYGLGQMVPSGDGKIIIGTTADGVVIFTVGDGTWERINNAALPGMTPDGGDILASVAYDAGSGTIFAGSMSYPSSSWYGVIAFSIYGAFYQGFYSTGEYTTGWDWSAAAQLTLGHFDKENTICIDDENGMWSLWTQIDETEQSAVWDHEVGPFEISDYIVNGQSVTVNWSVESPNKLSFVLSHGHLFDPQNQMSTLSQFLQMGRLVSLRLGETVSSVNYWQNQGTFVVKDVKLSYARGAYPTISVSCEDYTTIWGAGTIAATEDYDDTDPSYALEDLAEQYGLLTAAQIDVPTLANSHNIYHQFIDTSLTDCLKVILDHFGYFSYVNVEGVFQPRRVDLNAAVSHVYGSTDSIINFTPDTSFSSFTNRVTVTGEGRYLLEVLYDEESVGSMSGMIGWWGEKQVKRIYYSEDQAKVCRDPRLEIIQSVEDFWLFKYMGGGTEGITAVDYYETWVEVTIEGPDLTGIVIAEIVAVLVIGASSISCVYCGPWLFALSISLSILFYTLACVAAYSYNIWARPLGKEKQTIQAQADDVDMQQKLNGQIVETTIDDPLCYEVIHCQRVADFELSVVMAQRNRIKFEKTTHLQDEIGDVISIVHPYSGVVKNVFIAEMSRTYTKPDASVSSSGGVMDNIDGWVVS